MFVKKIAMLAATLLLSISAANAADEIDPFEKSQEIASGAFNMLKNALTSDRAKNIYEESGKAANGLLQGSIDSILPENSLCRIMEKNSSIIQQNEWWMTLGFDIQSAVLKQDKFVLTELPKINIFLKKLDIKAGHDYRMYSLPDDLNINERWIMFWNRDLTYGFGSYRCIRGNTENTFDNAIESVLLIAEHLGDEKARQKFADMLAPTSSNE